MHLPRRQSWKQMGRICVQENDVQGLHFTDRRSPYQSVRQAGTGPKYLEHGCRSVFL